MRDSDARPAPGKSLRPSDRPPARRFQREAPRLRRSSHVPIWAQCVLDLRDQLLNLVNQLLELRKLRSGKLEVNLVCADVVPYMTYMFESFRSMADRKQLNLAFESNVESLEMDYDPEKLLRIVSNLLSNAIKYTPEGGDITLRITSVEWRTSSVH